MKIYNWGKESLILWQVKPSRFILCLQVRELYLHFLCSLSFFAHIYIKYFNKIQIICTQLYGFKYSYLKLKIIKFQVIISI